MHRQQCLESDTTEGLINGSIVLFHSSPGCFTCNGTMHLSWAALLQLGAHGFQVPPESGTRWATRCYSQNNSQLDKVNGGASLILSTDNKSKLASAFSNLAENDQYDAVLTGLCAKILDDTQNQKAMSALQDPISLLQEMNNCKVQASGRSLMALIDVSQIMMIGSRHVVLVVFS
jgi:hypothetical protein